MMNIIAQRHTQLEHRFLITLLACSVFIRMCINIFMLAQVPPPPHMVPLRYLAMLETNIPPMAVAMVLLVAAFLVLPATISMAMWKHRFENRLLVKLAVAGYSLASLVWMIMAAASSGMGGVFLTAEFILNSVVALAFAAGLAVMLNNQMKRRLRTQKDETIKVY